MVVVEAGEAKEEGVVTINSKVEEEEGDGISHRSNNMVAVEEGTNREEVVITKVGDIHPVEEAMEVEGAMEEVVEVATEEDEVVAGVVEVVEVEGTEKEEVDKDIDEHFELLLTRICILSCGTKLYELLSSPKQLYRQNSSSCKYMMSHHCATQVSFLVYNKAKPTTDKGVLPSAENGTLKLMSPQFDSVM